MEPRIDTAKPHTARIYDYYLGGKDNFAADRRTAERAMQSWPAVRTAVRENRAFLGRAVRFLVAEAGIRQFLDIGTGLPSANNVHEVAQGLVPSCRVVYVDNDPIVLAHARALLTSSPEGKTAYIHADLREPEKILNDRGDPADARLHPAGRADAGGGAALRARLRRPAADRATRCSTRCRPAATWSPRTSRRSTIPRAWAAWCAPTRRLALPAQVRTADEFADLAFGGLDVVDPGVVLVSEWRPDSAGPRGRWPTEVNWYGGVARKP